MSKIMVLKINPVIANQSIYVFEEQNQIYQAECSIHNLISCVLENCKTYQINHIDIIGPKEYAQHYVKQMQDNLTQYNIGTLEIRYL